MLDEVVVALKQRRAIPAHAEGERHGTARVLELLKVVPRGGSEYDTLGSHSIWPVIMGGSEYDTLGKILLETLHITTDCF